MCKLEKIYPKQGIAIDRSAGEIEFHARGCRVEWQGAFASGLTLKNYASE